MSEVGEFLVNQAAHFFCMEHGLEEHKDLPTHLILHPRPAGLQQPSGEGSVGVGLDSCVIPTRHKDMYLVQTTDLYP